MPVFATYITYAYYGRNTIVYFFANAPYTFFWSSFSIIHAPCFSFIFKNISVH